MNELKLKIVDEFDKKLYSISTIDFRRNKVSVHFRGNLENVYDIDDVYIIQSTELMDTENNEVYEADLLSNGVKTFWVNYDKKKGSYVGIDINNNNDKRSLYLLLKENYIVIGNYYLR